MSAQPSPRSTAEIRIHNGSPTLFIDDRPTSAFAYVGDVPEFCADMSEAGLLLNSFVTRAQYAFYPDHPDPGAMAQRLADHDDKVRAIIEAWPEVRFFPRLQLEAPIWWHHRYPDDVARYDPGDGEHPAIPIRKHGIPSWASPLWREQTRAALRGYIAHVASSDYGERFLGYHLASGTSAEWMAFGSNGGLLVDYSPPTQAAFRAWLRKRYSDDVSGLRTAWRLGGVTFETAPIPSYQQRVRHDGPWLLDPRRDRQVIDYWTFFSEMTVDTIRLLAAEVKTATSRRAFVGVFYGYVLQLCNEHRQQNAGHMALRRLLACPDVDFLASPSHYGDRRLGEGSSSFMSVTESIRQHGKLWYNENDFMSPLGGRGAEDSCAETIEEYVEAQKFAYASVVCSGVSQWLLGFNEGWYHDPAIVALLKRQHEIDVEALSWDRTSDNQVAIVVDDASQLHQPVSNVLPVIDRDSASKTLIYDLPPRVGRCGVGVDWILLDDLDRIRPYRAYIVLNAFALDERKRNLLRWRVCRGGAAVLWMYAPGVIGKTLSTAGIEDLVGMRVRMSREAAPVRVVCDDIEHPLLSRTMADVRGMGDMTPIAPHFWIDDPRATILARHGLSGQPALGVRRFDDWTSVYLSSAVTLDERFIRELARWAGVHVFYEGEDATYIGPGLVAIHARESGRKRIALPRAADVRDLYANRLIGRGTPTIDVMMRRFDTRLFRFTS